VALALTAAVGVAGWKLAATAATGPPGGGPPGRHSRAALIAAIEAYYRAEDRARATGDPGPIDAVTAGRGSPANQNFRAFMLEQAVAGRRSVNVGTTFSDWDVQLDGDAATVVYAVVERGHDVDAASGRALEPDQDTARTLYRARLLLWPRGWVLFERDPLRDL
jgi:hypothetical protein